MCFQVSALWDANSAKLLRMNLWFRSLASFEDEAAADAEFWLRMTPDERVAVVEQLRADWWIQHGQADEGLRRTVAILRLPRS